ncbi:MAG: AAA family ATPase [Bacteroidales bacterium]|nr:AAA family ATPase [Bacteroidales bacterium]
MENKRKLLNDFLAAFPLESLSEMSLDKYTNLNRFDSFCYWVESRTYELGSIWGGSSYKFGIYKYNEKPKGKLTGVMCDEAYAWYTKNGNTAEEAYAWVRSEIVKIANHARNGEFEAIDNITTFGDVFKWKIAFLYSNEHLIPIYKRTMLEQVSARFGLDNPKDKSIAEMQRYLIEKKGPEDLFVFYDRLLQMLGNNGQNDVVQSSNKHYWLYAPGEGASKWNLCQQENMICIGWDDMEDLGQYDSVDSVRAHLKEVYGKPDASFKNDGLAIWEFVHAVKPGDVIYVKSGISKIVGRGIVQSDYIYDESYEDFRNIHKVEWTNIGMWDAPHNSVLKTLTDITKYPDYVEALEALFNASVQKRYWWLVANPKIWSMADLAVGSTVEYNLYNDNGKQRRIFQNFLDAKVGDAVIGYESTPVKQIVGLAEVSKEQNGETIEFVKKEALKNPIDFSTIKTIEGLKEMQFLGNPQGSFFSLSEAEYDQVLDIIRESNAVPVVKQKEFYTKDDFLNEVYMDAEAYDSLVGLLRQKKNVILQGAPGVGKTFTAKRLAYSMLGLKDDDQIEMVQFHQNFSYEDFIMGYKPTEDGGFVLRSGIFYNFCKKAKSNPDKQYFFIIDEINRGNLSKIFGELLMLIENGYRGKNIKLAYTGEDFTVPENIYIIGMMNTADRSLAMIDYALRRRFSFFEMEPGFSTDGFKQYQESIHDETFDRVIDAIVNLNNIIANDDSLGSGFCIGHSYFCNQKTVSKDWLKNVVNYDIAPMLKEYWFDDPQKSKMQIDIIKSTLS